jgi:hypothetical protein
VEGINNSIIERQIFQSSKYKRKVLKNIWINEIEERIKYIQPQEIEITK